MVVIKALNIAAIDYSAKYVVWSLPNLRTEVISFIRSMLSIFKTYLLNYTFFKVYACCLLALLIFGGVKSYKKRDVMIFFLSIGIILSTLVFYFLSGNASMPIRAFTVFGIFCGLVVAMVFDTLVQHGKKYVWIFFLSIVVFYQSREIQQIFQDDYLRFQKDANLAREINGKIEEKCQGIPSVPVVFIGSPLGYVEYPNREDDVNMRSMFSQNENHSSIRIHSFFHLLGYDYISPLLAEPTPDNYVQMGTNYYTLKAVSLAENMEIWPKEGSVLADDEVIVVKLGPLSSQHFEMSTEEFDKYLGVENIFPAEGNIWIARQEGVSEDKIIYIKGLAFFEDISSRGTRIQVVLDKGNEHFLLGTTQTEMLNEQFVAPIDKGKGNLNQFLIYGAIPGISPGEWKARIVISNGSQVSLIEDVGIQTINIR